MILGARAIPTGLHSLTLIRKDDYTGRELFLRAICVSQQTDLRCTVAEISLFFALGVQLDSCFLSH